MYRDCIRTKWTIWFLDFGRFKNGNVWISQHIHAFHFFNLREEIRSEKCSRESRFFFVRFATKFSQFITEHMKSKKYSANFFLIN